MYIYLKNNNEILEIEKYQIFKKKSCLLSEKTSGKRKLDINNVNSNDESEEEELIWVDIRKKSETSRSNSPEAEEKNSPIKLPDFSATVTNGLRENDSITVWSMMIEQLAHHCLDNYGKRLKTSADYKDIGRLMYKKYPSVKR